MQLISGHIWIMTPKDTLGCATGGRKGILVKLYW